ncbi:MAG: MMPL family transporter [Gammaproteobacteria bacterium]|nr:MMPL family transporter [Gammaproteobacteria bacterium]MDH4254730.1 MMPL family transporter [Gammaproteobacteria bacterium]MDH5308692.1 MMPL family transporter [Gammaproteobacteria bacterium]
MKIDWLNVYERAILRHPVAVIAACAILLAVAGWFAPRFALDASADSLTLEHDEALNYYRFVRARYGSDDFLIVTFSPRSRLFSEESLAVLRALRDELATIEDVESVVSILDVPLISSPPLSLKDLPGGIRRLEDPATNPELARKELTESPLYADYVISRSGQITALRIDFRQDEQYLDLRNRRDQLRERQFENDLSDEERRALAEAEARFDDYSRTQLDREQRNISSVRGVLDRYAGAATMHLGGVPMIVADSIDFIRHDIVVFGVAVILFLILILGTAFHKFRWIALPLLTCLTTCVSMVGLLGLLDWRVTVVSSNFLSLLLILCLALTLHIIVRYRECHVQSPDAPQYELVRETVRRIVIPCLYTVLTTMVAFGSLLVSGIRPVIDFGWMMVIGLAIGFVYSFTLFPAVLLLLETGEPRPQHDITAAITAFFARLIERHGRLVLIVFGTSVVLGIVGITRLSVENRFIDYYRESTEISRGMQLIDRELGGTTPLDVIIDAPRDRMPAEIEGSPGTDNILEEFDDIYAEADAGEAGITATSYWFNSRRIPTVLAMHDYLESQPETGKVISVATAATMLRRLDQDILGDNVGLSIVYRKLPTDVREALFDPYLSPDGNQLRFSIRVFESDPTLRRGRLLERIQRDLEERFGVSSEQLHMSGMLVLYNNMLESLFRSQIATIGAVFLAILAMFVVLFRSLRLALTGIVPNVASATLVLGIMGWLSIPLDLMTITIAAITIGIAVDDTIHYIHRFDREFSKDENYWETVRRCHRTIGRAMYYTSITIMLGFSILALSQFVPTVYFGLLTGFAMLVALLANMTLLPLLLVLWHAEAGRRQVRRVKSSASA